MVRRYGVLVGCMLAAVMVFAVGVCAADEEQGCEVAKEEAKVELPAAVADALKAAFPEAKIEGVELEKECGLTIYEVELVQEGEPKMEVEVAPEGRIIKIETEIAQKDVPEAALQAIQAADPDAKCEEVQKIRICIKIEKAEADKPAQLVQLDKAEIVYEAELKKDGKEGEITVAADGKIIEPLKWKEEEKKEKGEKGECGEAAE
ncbi:MAG: PepSY-like domain-containing protein [Phycisphaerae bacterium]|nr:PepSY-like domain-containing protein [Phycisphaerae bacterium]